MADLQLWVCVENNVVMMAASTPGLRPLLRRKTGNAYPYPGSGPQDHSHVLSDGVQHQGWSGHSFSKKMRQGNTANASHMDNNSEELILGDGDRAKDGQITKTLDVRVSYSE